MEETTTHLTWKEEDENHRAQLIALRYAFQFVDMAVVKCAIELGLPEIIVSQEEPTTLLYLSTTLGCAPSHLQRIMRHLVHSGIFNEKSTVNGSKGYTQTPISCCLMKSDEKSAAALILLESSPTMLSSWHNLSARILGCVNSPFEAAHGQDIWSYAETNPAHGLLISEAMACLAKRSVSAVIENCLHVFNGLESVVDVGGSNGTALGMLVKACPWIRGINFDLPHVVSVAHEYEGVEHVGGNMFDCVPKADAVYIMGVLHDWGDDDCIHILNKCKEAIPNDKGKVIIVDPVIEEDNKKEQEDKLITDLKLGLDMIMMAQTNTGRERTLKEWAYVLGQVGFSRYNVIKINAMPSVIEAFP